MSLHAELKDLYGRYVAAWNAEDFAGAARHFAEPALLVSSQRTTVAETRLVTAEVLGRLHAEFKLQGMTHAAFGALEAKSCADGLVILDVEDISFVRADGSVIAAFDAHYVVGRGERGWEITSAVICAQGWRAC